MTEFLLIFLDPFGDGNQTYYDTYEEMFKDFWIQVEQILANQDGSEVHGQIFNEVDEHKINIHGTIITKRYLEFAQVFDVETSSYVYTLYMFDPARRSYKGYKQQEWEELKDLFSSSSIRIDT